MLNGTMLNPALPLLARYRSVTAQIKDPLGTMRALYERFGTPFTAEAQAGMEAMMAYNPQNKHGKHEYTLEEFGLSREDTEALIMQARVKAGWIKEEDLAPPPAEETRSNYIVARSLNWVGDSR